MKLSKHQRSVLQRMADGDEIWATYGRDPHVWWVQSYSDRSPGHNTVYALLSRGLIARYEYQAGSGKYRITDAGRVALTEN